MRKRKFFLALVLTLLLIIVWQHEIIFYGLSQARGQLKVVFNARPVEEVLNDPLFPDSLKNKILLIQEIKKFATDSLGLKSSENYSTFYDQGGKPVLWVVTACEPFELKNKEWKFPLLGSFSYKGFFIHQKAIKEQNELKKEGYDTSLDEVGGWSTLGWFKDPILSNMLKRTPGSLANLIIHELTHGTLYVKDNVDYNENLASFIGDKGALMFLIYKYGEHSGEYIQYKENRIHMKEYTALVLQSSNRLDSLYKSFLPHHTEAFKKEKKQLLMDEIILSLNEYLTYFKEKNPRYYEKIEDINNTYFMDFRRYRESLDVFEEEFTNNFHSDFKLYFNYLVKKYPSL